MKNFLYSAIDLIFPSDCIICKTNTIRYPIPICQECEKMIIGGQIPPIASSKKITEILSCRSYKNIIRDCILYFKYRQSKYMIFVLEKIIKNVLSEKASLNNKLDLIVPVPIHKKRRRIRGFNQSEIIAKTVSNFFPAPHAFHNLIKTKNTTPQIGLNKKERIKNLENSFTVTSPYELIGKTILLVDDVITTGATLDTCAEELLHSGAKEVYGFTIARTLN